MFYVRVWCDRVFMRRLIVVRSGEVLCDRGMVSGGWRDGSLSERGSQQCIAVAKRLLLMDNIDNYDLFSCGLLAERQSTKVIGKALGIDPVFIEGVWGPDVWMETKYANTVTCKQVDSVAPSCVGDTGFLNALQIVLLYDRVSGFLNSSRHVDKAILVAGFDTIQMIIHWWFGSQIRDLLRLVFSVDHGSISILDKTPYQKQINCLNDTGHLSTLYE